MLQIAIRYERTVPILTLAGRWDGHGASIFEARTRELTGPSVFWVLDASGVEYLSSAGIRSLVRAEKELRLREGGIVLVGVGSAVGESLCMTGLLDRLRSAKSCQAAIEAVLREHAGSAESTGFEVDGCGFVVKQMAANAGTGIDVWGRACWPPGGPQRGADLAGVTLDELGFAFGIGGLGRNAEQAAQALGEFAALGRCVVLLPADGHCQPDFLLSDVPEQSLVYVADALGLVGLPTLAVDVTCGEPRSLAVLLDALLPRLVDARGNDMPLAGCVLAATDAYVHGAVYRTAEGLGQPCERTADDVGQRALLAVGIVGIAESARSCPDTSIRELLDRCRPQTNPGGTFFAGAGVVLGTLPDTALGGGPAEAARAATTLENLESVTHLDTDTRLLSGRLWLYLNPTVCPGEAKRMKIDTGDGADVLDEWRAILRRIYAGASRLVLDELTGGFSSKTYRVTSFDGAGRRMLPTVVKFGSLELTRREEEAYRKHVQNYILNNSTTIMGSNQQGDWAGLCYNFVGITGPESKLSWLTHLYQERPVEDLLPLFDELFTHILKPWYGQPRLQKIRPYAEHDPRRLFGNLLPYAERELGISPDDEWIDCPELGTTLPNPFHFLKHEYPRRAQTVELLWYTGITHGDLNMQNVLVDEKQNLYVIDFAETRERNIVADFARIEPILIFEMTRVEEDKDVAELLRFVAGLLEPDCLGQALPFVYEGTDPMVEKAYRVICKLRGYADTVTLFETNLAPYLIALLEWTLPVVSYGSVNHRQRRLAACGSALICRKLMCLDQE